MTTRRQMSRARVGGAAWLVTKRAPGWVGAKGRTPRIRGPPEKRIGAGS
jgi:hypothetical protein